LGRVEGVAGKGVDGEDMVSIDSKLQVMYCRLVTNQGRAMVLLSSVLWLSWRRKECDRKWCMVNGRLPLETRALIFVY
jgi:hypothetical protein